MEAARARAGGGVGGGRPTQPGASSFYKDRAEGAGAPVVSPGAALRLASTNFPGTRVANVPVPGYNECVTEIKMHGKGKSPSL